MPSAQIPEMFNEVIFIYTNNLETIADHFIDQFTELIYYSTFVIRKGYQKKILFELVFYTSIL